jgi:hypothetical protein
MVVGDHKSEVAIRVEDQDDGGDLYTFQPLGAVRPAAATVRLDGRGSFRFDTCDIDLEARRGEGDFVRFNAEIDNRAPDHRIRVLLRLPRPASSSRAGSPFDLVERPIRGESGESEPGSTLWPARGSVVAGGSGFLSEGVTEYELLGDELALTLMRCTGTISRAGPLPVRKIPAGPDVATPEAQLIGKNRISFGVFLHDPGTGVMKEWERYALPLMTTSGSGGGGPASSPLLELTTPALSSVRRIENEVRVTIFNPFETEQRYSLRGETATIGAHRIEML